MIAENMIADNMIADNFYYNAQVRHCCGFKK
jgi:hypothetical protein